MEVGVVAGVAAVIVLLIAGLSVHAARRMSRVTLSEAPTPVTVVLAREARYRETRSYVGALEPWIEASVGPQYISAYVESVLVRPGAVVRKGQVLATLDCAHPSAETRAVAMRERAVDARSRATADEAQRVEQLLDGGFVARNEAEQKSAASTAAHAEREETRANLTRALLDVGDCVQRAPFAGEVGTRSFDPGAFVHPGAAIVSVVDRSTVRVTVDAPEKDFDALAPGKMVSVLALATGARFDAPISRRAPRADPQTRTVHFEVDAKNPDRSLPAGTTAVVQVAVGQPVAASSVPMYAAAQETGNARLFVVERGLARGRMLPVLGEAQGELYFAPRDLPPGTLVVTEGRELIVDGERVRETIDTFARDGGTTGQPGRPERGGGYGRPL